MASQPRPARLVMSARPTPRDHLHGAWWPHSDVLGRELTDLLDALTERNHVARGGSLNRDEWPGAPLVVSLSGAARLKVGWYGLSEPNLLVLPLRDQRKRNLLVVPP